MLLPWDVIQEILMRLPVKSLVRFKRVCKSWHSLISDPHFAKSHYELSPALSHKLLHIASVSEARSIDFYASLNDDSFAVRLIPPLSKPGKYGWFPIFGKDDWVRILGSCRGFVLIENYPNLYIWNPLTGFNRQLSYSEITGFYKGDLCFNMRGEHPRVTIHLTGFGYDSSTDDYLIIIVLRLDGDAGNRLMLFSLRTNSRKEIQGFHLPDFNSFGYQSWFFNDTVHWLAVGDHAIIAFDLVENNLYEIALPDVDFNYDPLFSSLVTMGECLGFCTHTFNKTQVWVMKEHRVQSSWTLIEIPRPLSAVCMTKGGELIALSSHVAELMKFNEKGELLERCKYRCADAKAFNLAMYTESLFSLPND